MFTKISVVSLILLFMLGGCGFDPNSQRGFSLPIGDIEEGEKIFKEFKCLACHKLEGYDDTLDMDESVSSKVSLGGGVTRVKTYAELVTSVINPSHRIVTGYPLKTVSVIEGSRKSKMKNYNDVMTVSQLIDIVTFLQSKYKLEQYTRTTYGDIAP